MTGQEEMFGEAGPDEDTPFEDVMRELEGIVAKLEAGELSLESSLAAFERGMALSRGAEQRLDVAEQRVERLVSGADGETTVAFEGS